MPWHIGKHASCPASKPHAVIKDADGSLAGCHASEDSAKRQLAALYAQEGTMKTDVRGEPIALAADKVDDEGLQWIEVLPTAEQARNGDWYFTITDEDLQTYAAALQASDGKVAIDWDHLTDDGGSTRAAGWFTGEAEVRDGEDGPRLWAQVRWSKSGRSDVEGGDYRFISPVFSFENIDEKTGLMTKAKEILRATLTNNPFFTQLAPVASLLDSKVFDKIVARHGEEVAKLVRAGLEEESGEAREAADAILASLPQDEPEEQPPPPEEDNPDGETVPNKEEAEMPDTKALAAIYGLGEDATDEEIVAAARATKEKADAASDLGLSGMSLAEIGELKAKAAKGEDADKRLRNLEITMLLDEAVREFKILPSQKDTYRVMAERDFDSVKAHIESTPKDALKLAAQGFDTPERQQETKAVAATVEKFDSEHADGVDTDSAEMHVRAEAILREQGKTPGTYTADEYRTALEQVQAEAA